MEWQQIIGFYNVAKSGSFTKAAEATYRSQSAISQQVKNLEGEIGCPLFERIGKRKLRLTSAGEKFFIFSKNVFENYKSLTEELNEIKGLQIGHLKVAGSFSTLYHLLPSLLKRYINKYSKVKLTVLDRSQQEVINHIKNGDIDFGFLLESHVPKTLTALRWKEVKTILMTPIEHPLTKVKKVTLEQIGKYPLIFPPVNFKYRSILEDRFKKLGIEYNIIMESSNVELSSKYVEMGLGISFATIVEDLPEFKKRLLNFLPLDHLFKSDHIAIAFRRKKKLNSYKNAFIKFLFEEISN